MLLPATGANLGSYGESAPGWAAFVTSFAALPNVFEGSLWELATDEPVRSCLLGAFANIAFLASLTLLLLDRRFRRLRVAGTALAAASVVLAAPIGFFCQEFQVFRAPGYWVWTISFAVLAFQHAGPAYARIWSATPGETATEIRRACVLAAPFALVLAPLVCTQGRLMGESPFLLVSEPVAATGSVCLLCLALAFGLRLGAAPRLD
jgi:hypothetical protein